MNISQKQLSLITAACLVTLGSLQGCSSFSDGDSKINYRSETAAKSKPLDVPPDLTQLTSKDPRYNVPKTSVSANAYGTVNAAPATSSAASTNSGNVAPRQINDVTLVRDRDERWLHVNRNADQVWPIVHEFWLTNGFVYVEDKPEIGLLETDWAENRAKIPMDFIRRTIGKVFDGAYSSGERDKFKIRVERSESSGVDIFVSQYGMSEEFVDQSKTQTKWLPRPRDPLLEAEFLSRLMVQLGGNKEVAQQITATPVTPAAPVSSADLSNPDALILKDSFDVSWRRVGVALDRNGFTVEDRDRNQGIYFVRYVQSSNQEEPGFFSRMFSSSKATNNEPQKFRIVIKTEANTTRVTVQNSQGQSDTGDIAKKILKLLSQNL